MIRLQELSAGVYGAWRLAWADPAGLGYFDASERGFWQSFWAAAIAAPAYVLIVGINLADPDGLGSAQIDGTRLLLVESIAYVMGWTVFPLAMVTVASKLGRDAQYARYIVASNWGGLIEMTAFLPAVALGETVPAISVLPALVGCAMFAYQWFIARTALALSNRQALIPVAVNFTLGVAIALVARALLTAPA